MKNKYYKASVLILTMIILGIILITALSISLTSLRERKASIGSSRSGEAYQAAESGIESVMAALLKADEDATVSTIGDCSVPRGSIYAVITGAEYDYQVELKKEEETEPTNCRTKVCDIASLKSVGSDSGKQEQRAIEAAVAATRCSFGSWDSKAKETVYHADSDGFVIGIHKPLEPDETCREELLSDSHSNPSTPRSLEQNRNDGTGGTLFSPVKKGDYWKVTGDCYIQYLFWLPLDC